MSAAEYQAIKAEGIRQEIERAVPVDFSVDLYHDDLLLSSNRPVVTVGGPPVLSVEFTDTPGELIQSLGPLLDNIYNLSLIHISEPTRRS